MSLPVAVTIGNFDGVHLGHQALIRACRAEVGSTGRVVVIAFDPHPQSVLAARGVPERLTTFDERARVLLETGADEVRRLAPDAQLLGMDARSFAEQVAETFKPTAWVEGSDFRFGRNRVGDLALIRKLGVVHKFTTIEVESVEVDLEDQTVVPVSSSMVRWLVLNGRVADAARLLGRPYRYSGRVVRCDRRGRTIGFPTANIDGDMVMPANGIYACHATLPDGRVLPAAVNVGTRPTVDGHHRCVEAHVLGLEQGTPWAPLPGLPEYNWVLAIDFVAWLREEVKFNSIDALVDQMHRDCARVFDFLPTPAGDRR